MRFRCMPHAFLFGSLLGLASASLHAADPAPEVKAVEPEFTEFLEMFTAIVSGAPMGPGGGWFHPAASRYSWEWLAAKHGITPKESIAKADFRGPAELFARLDRNKDGVISAEDFKPVRLLPKKAPEPATPPPPNDMPDQWTLLKGLFQGEIGSASMGPRLEQTAPDFTLFTPDRKKSIRLSSFRDKKPVVLVFGSFT